MTSPDPWQSELLSQLVTAERNVLVCCSRQVGKTEAVAAAAYLAACLGQFVLVVSPSDRQSLEFFSRLLTYHHRLGLVPAAATPTKHELCLAGGGRVLAVPNSEGKIRSLAAVDLLVVDEAARVPDPLYGAVRPMLAVSGGRTVLLSTPFGERGFFWREWTGQGAGGWCRHRLTWRECPRIRPDFIAAERASHGELWVRQEYECAFLQVTGLNPLNPAAFRDCIDDSAEVLEYW
jgi:hypothetical protein